MPSPGSPKTQRTPHHAAVPKDVGDVLSPVVLAWVKGEVQLRVSVIMLLGAIGSVHGMRSCVNEAAHASRVTSRAHDHA
jgi:hypothetical protein